MTLTPGVDFFGHDYQTLKDISLESCRDACSKDSRCQAFTFNRKVGWCFLKDGVGDRHPFADAISGQIASAPAATDEAFPDYPAELLKILPSAEIDRARKLAQKIAAADPVSSSVPDLVTQARNAGKQKDFLQAASLYRQALQLSGRDQGLWLSLSRTARVAKSESWSERRQLELDAVSAALNAYLYAGDDHGRALALEDLARAYARRKQWPFAIRIARQSLAREENPNLRETYEKWRAEHGFRITGNEVQNEAANPRVCIRFSDPIAQEQPHLADFVRVLEHDDLPVEVEAKQICIDGVVHGGQYRIQVRPGLPAADGEVLSKGADLVVYVRDRSPMVRFLGRAYVLPKGGEAAIPVVSVNTGQVDAEVYRIGDRGLTSALTEGLLRRQLGEWDRERISDQAGQKVWEGHVEVESRLNQEITTAIPVGAMVPQLQPGIYALTVRAHNAKQDDDDRATQWFVVSDLGLTTLSGNDGLHVLVRSLSTAQPTAQVKVRLIALNDEVLGEAETDARGHARLDPGLLRGTGGNAPALLVASGPDQDYTFLDLTQPPFDLSDRGVTGRPAPQPLDTYLVSERGAYRPGETVHLTALVRDTAARAMTGVPLTLVLKRPDGVESARMLLQDQGQGGYQAELPMSASAMHGTWNASVYADPEGTALATLGFLVEDFMPERLTFDLESPQPAIDADDPADVALDARFLYGAPASDLEVEGDLQIRASAELPEYPGVHFGLDSEQFNPLGDTLPEARTDAQGKAQVPLALPELPATSKPLQAEVTVRVLETGGRPVERSLVLPLDTHQSRLGIKPLFGGAVEEGGNARFEILAVDANGKRQALKDVRWTLVRLHKTFQWYESDGRWDYEPVVSTERVANGTVQVGTDDRATIEAPVHWGTYRLSLAANDGTVLPADLEFQAGWYVAPATEDTPDQLRVSLDQPRYRIGDTAKVHLETRFAGVALVMAIDDRLIDMRAVEVTGNSADVSLPVTDKWGPGAYVTAVLYRPMDLQAKRMPGRAIGLSWAATDPQQRRLDLKIALPAEQQQKVTPRRTLEVPLEVANAVAGQEMYVTLAAVDVGILNLTRYQAPDPDGWYFGQRRLGMEIRDLYGQLIDRMQGVKGVVRSGGDGDMMRMQGPPPTEKLMAFQSGIVRLDADGKARIAFDIPDFNGTLRLMAMAWSASGVGHAVQDLVVRDPIVVTATLPRFLAPGDQSRLALELAHVDGPPGKVGLRVQSVGGHVRVDPAAAEQTLDLAAGARARVNVPITANEVGDDTLTVVLRTPEGADLEKTLTLGVRSNAPETGSIDIVQLEPGETRRLTAGRFQSMVPGSGLLSVSAGVPGGIDVAGLLLALDRYPYGCTEQLTSRGMPLLYLGQVAEAVGGSTRGDLAKRVNDALTGVLANQDSSGGFGVWGPDDGSSLWLDAYVSDFLTRAREEGYTVPQTAFDMALANLRNQLSYAADFSHGGEGVAYALYVLARNGQAAIGDLRYYETTRLDAFATPLARAQLGAALALYGDAPRANHAYDSAYRLFLQTVQKKDEGWRVDYGSHLRDGAALLALALAGHATGVDTQDLVTRLQKSWAAGAYLSTQDQTWLLMAVHALLEGATPLQFTVNGQSQKVPLFTRLDAVTLTDHPLEIGNTGKQPLTLVESLTGVPRTPPPAGGNGYEIDRVYYDLEGRGVDPSQVALGTRLVTVLTIRAQTARQARLLVDDPLPAGFRIDNPHLLRSGDLANLRWLSLNQQPVHSEFRADRFVAALNPGRKSARQFQLAYLVRAIAPGHFVHPAASVVDMYRPQLRAWTDTGSVEITAP